jgi:hypothetical protein
MSVKDELIREIELRLGGGMVDVELDSDHYELAISKALRKYRQRGSRAVIEKFLKLNIKMEQQEYQLPQQVVNVRDVFLRHTGAMGVTSTGVDLEPFNTMYLSNMLLQSNTNFSGLLNYELYADRRELLARMFGAYCTFTFSPGDRSLFIHRKFRADDEVYLWTFVEKADEELLNDVYCGPWIKDYAMAQAKFILGEARSKFSTIAGPQGGTSLNGDNLKSEAAADMEKLEEDLKLYADGSDPLGFIIG